MTVRRGYATIGFLTEDVATEKNTGFAHGVFKCVEKPEARTDESWGAISAWARPLPRHRRATPGRACAPRAPQCLALAGRLNPMPRH